ncbi:MAG TPA: GH92 family glycosyl hydrolase [Solirubrobacterales bacterium]|nr:GH92 family glycosyl hydrolase [Solirubrobacterales bacterium]
MRRAAITILAALLALSVAPPATPAAGLADHVDVFAGTEPGVNAFGGGHDFPGATLPFGMVQWGPDTVPADRHSGGYDYRDSHLSGFSLTHLSGAGCALYGDFPFLPTTEPITDSPAAVGGGLSGRFQPGFSHAGESAHPGFYSVHLNPVGGGAIDTALTATTRTGMARFAFPRSPHASVLVDAGGSAKADDLAEVQIDPAAQEISGSASSGYFCAQRPRYRVYFAAVFDRPFDAFGTWTRQQLEPGSTAALDQKPPSTVAANTAQAGAYASFDTRHNPDVAVRVGISFVSVAGARANLAAESGSAPFGNIAATAEESWNRALASIRVGGGSSADIDTFYTALYHALLAPRAFNDAGGRYIGMDGAVHDAGGRTQYADLSGWDVYRTQIPLLAMLMPGRASDIVASMLADAAQSGCLPRWPYANGQSMTMVGDPADPMIASAAAFGAKRFDTGAALAAMVKGASEGCSSADGSYVQRQGLAQYKALGYVPFDIDVQTRNANSLFGEPEDVWASAATTLEYAIADFSIAQFAARARHEAGAYSSFMLRSGNWRNLLNPESGQIEPRFEDGTFPPEYDNLRGAGFAEGDSVQYTWMVPQDPAGLFAAIGGKARAVSRLDRFLRVLNGGPGATHTDHALLGNEPNLNVPWLYDWAGQPYKTQAAVRRALRLYDTAPDGYPGNDDLGTLSSWYVFGALGLYPEVPGVDLLAIGSPLFERATVRLPGGRKLRIAASAYRRSRPRRKRHSKSRLVPLALSRAPYIQGMSIDGHGYERPWTTFCALARGASIAYRLGARPDRAWGGSAAARPPSFGTQRPMPQNRCAP